MTLLALNRRQVGGNGKIHVLYSILRLLRAQDERGTEILRLFGAQDERGMEILRLLRAQDERGMEILRQFGEAVEGSAQHERNTQMFRHNPKSSTLAVRPEREAVEGSAKQSKDRL